MVQISRIHEMGAGGGGGSPNYKIVNGVVVATGVGAAMIAAPAAASAVRFLGMSATGVVPMLGEAFTFAVSRKWITLSNAGTAGLAASNVVGVVNIIVHRDNISSFAQDKFAWILDNAESNVASGYEQSQKKTRTLVRSGGSRGGRGATTLSQRASRSVRPGKRRRRCRYRNKSGKTCLRPRNHGGRHRYR